MKGLTKDQIGNKGLRGVDSNHGRPSYKKIGLKFEDTPCGPLATRYRHCSAVHHLVVKRSSYDFFFYYDSDRESSFQTNVVIGRRQIRVEGMETETASVMRRRREADSLAHFSPLPLVSLETSRLRRISDRPETGMKQLVN